MERERSVSDAGLQHLLVVEDNPGDARFIEEAFREAQIELTLHAVETGEDALDFVHGRGPYDDAPRPDVVLLDWSLPGTSGPEVLREIKATFPDVRVVVMSGSRPREKDVESMRAEADAYTTKPSDPEGYLEVVRSVV